MTAAVALLLWSMTVSLISFWVGSHWWCKPGDCPGGWCPDRNNEEVQS